TAQGERDCQAKRRLARAVALERVVPENARRQLHGAVRKLDATILALRLDEAVDRQRRCRESCAYANLTAVVLREVGTAKVLVVVYLAIRHGVAPPDAATPVWPLVVGEAFCCC